MEKNADFSGHHFTGLTEEQVKEKQLQNGFNELPNAVRRLFEEVFWHF